ncbi:MAG: putative O-glycosylation ligase, exosortase A system-associated [Geminicoccaceae bacterium]
MRNYLFFLLFLPMPFLSFFRPWIGMLLWGWLSLLNPHRDLYGFASTLPYNELIAIPTLAGWLVSGEFRKLRLDLTVALLILLWGLMTVSTIFSLAPEQSWPKWDEFSKIMLYAIVLRSFLTTRTRIHTLIWLLVLCLGFYGAKGGALFIASGGTHQFTGPPGTMIEDRNYLALAVLMVIPLMNYLRLQSRHLLIRLGLIGAMLFSVLAVVGTYSRGGFIGLLAMAGTVWLRSRHKLPSLVLVVGALMLLLHLAPPAWFDRMSTIQSAEQEDDSFKSRLVAWKTYLVAANDRPLTGAGFYALNSAVVYFNYQPFETGIDYHNSNARAAHSIYFQLLGELGFPAFFVYFTIIGYCLWCTHSVMVLRSEPPSQIWRSDLARMMQATFISFLVAGAALSSAFYDLILITIAIASTLACQIRPRFHIPTSHQTSKGRLYFLRNSNKVT